MTNNIAVPMPFAAYATAVNKRDATAMYNCFAQHATVADDGHTYNSPEAIRQWCVQTLNQYHFTISSSHAAAEGDETIVAALFSTTVGKVL